MICVGNPSKDAYSATFIRAHVKHCPTKMPYLGSFSPLQADQTFLLLALHHPTPGIWRSKVSIKKLFFNINMLPFWT